jgi:hypothetical protein
MKAANVTINYKIPAELRKTIRMIAAETGMRMEPLIVQLLKEAIANRSKAEQKGK